MLTFRNRHLPVDSVEPQRGKRLWRGSFSDTCTRERAAKFEATNNWHAFAVRDGNLIIGHNPHWLELVTKRVIDALRST